MYIYNNYAKEKQRSRDGVMNYFLSWCRPLLVAFLFHAMTSLLPPSFHRNDFSTCVIRETVETLSLSHSFPLLLRQTCLSK